MSVVTQSDTGGSRFLHHATLFTTSVGIRSRSPACLTTTNGLCYVDPAAPTTVTWRAKLKTRPRRPRAGRTAAACRRSSIKSSGGLPLSSTMAPLSDPQAPESPGHKEFVHATVECVMLEWNIGELRCQPQPGEAAEEGAVNHMELHPGQSLAEALMRAEAKRHMLAGIADACPAVWARGRPTRRGRLDRSAKHRLTTRDARPVPLSVESVA